ncbi:hypothetical protein KR059_007726 [Drosophila kikkawai]|nr:hypothetical protein KR059_007726 [Drosophila kikkawai]
MDGRKLQNIWTMRPLEGTGGALKALAKNVAQHMNLNRSTLKRVVAQVVAEHHNLGQVDDYKGHMYFAKPERLNFLNLLAQSKEALDDLLLLDPRLAKKFQRRDHLKKLLKPPRVSSLFKIKDRSRSGSLSKSKSRIVVSAKLPAPAAAHQPGKGSSSLKLVKKSACKPVQALKKTSPKSQQQVGKEAILEQRTVSGSLFRSRSGSPRRSPKTQLTSTNHQRLPAGSTRRTAGSSKKPKAAAILPQIKSKSKVKTVGKDKMPAKTKANQTKTKSSNQAERDAVSVTEPEPPESHLRTKSKSHSHSRSRSRSRSRSHCRLPSASPSPSSVTATTVKSRRSPRRQQDKGVTAKALTKALTKALVKPCPQNKIRTKVKPREKPRLPPPALPPYRNYDKPWLVSRAKRRRLVAGSLEQQQQINKSESVVMRKPRSHVGRQMRNVNFPWYTPYQFQGGAGATQQPSPRSSSVPLMARLGPNLTCRQRHHRMLAERKKRDIKREEPIDNMLSYGSGLFRRHRGEWMPARKSSSREMQKATRITRSSSLQRPREVRRERSLTKVEKPQKPQKPVKPVKPSPEVADQLPPPPPSAVSSDDRVRPHRKARDHKQKQQQQHLDSSLGSYADLFQPSDSKEALKRAKRRLSIAFKQTKGSARRHRPVNPVWK